MDPATHNLQIDSLAQEDAPRSQSMDIPPTPPPRSASRNKASSTSSTPIPAPYEVRPPSPGLTASQSTHKTPNVGTAVLSSARPSLDLSPIEQAPSSPTTSHSSATLHLPPTPRPTADGDIEKKLPRGSGSLDAVTSSGGRIVKVETATGEVVVDEEEEVDDRLPHEIPTEEDLKGENALKRVPAKIPLMVYPVAFVEVCERMSYCGTISILVNFIQRGLPPGSSTGAGGHHGHSGALGLGQRASTAITTFDTFWSYTLPLLGGWIADTHWGRYLTIQRASAASILGHILLLLSSLPPLLVHTRKTSLVLLIVGILILGFGTGGFKANVSPLMADQFPRSPPRVKTLKSGERVIVDYELTITRLYGYFYLVLQVGAIVGATAMVYAEKYAGFWVAFVLPTGMYAICPLVMWACRRSYRKKVPVENALGLGWRTWRRAMKGRWGWRVWNMKKALSDDQFWEKVKPSNIPPDQQPNWMTFDDKWVDEFSRGLRACKLFMWFPIYWLANNQMNNNLVSQAATLRTGSVPNDFISNINPLALILCIPLFDSLIYPLLNHPPMLHRITVGFFVAALALASAAVLQHYIYVLSPCGKGANSCPVPADISVWWQVIPYGLIGLSEMLAITSGMEMAYKESPEGMKSLVMAAFLAMSAAGCVLSQALVPLAEDPWLVGNYAVPAGVVVLGTVGVWWTGKGMMREKKEKEEKEMADAAEARERAEEMMGVGK